MYFLSVALLGLGVLLLGLALWNIKKILAILDTRELRRHWLFMGSVIVLFILGYVAYSFTMARDPAHTHMIAPLVFLGGSVFCVLITNLSFRTALDLKRMSVLERENITDPLMGIYNRRYFEEVMEKEFARSKRYQLPLSLLIIDVDHFKRVNDTRGHQAGDCVLRALGERLRQGIRETDTVARFGGEEVVVVAPNTPVENLTNMAERLRKSVEAMVIPIEAGAGQEPPIQVTVSIGGAAFQEGLSSHGDILKAADECLYRAKEAGRNRVVICSLPNAEDAPGPEESPGT